MKLDRLVTERVISFANSTTIPAQVTLTLSLFELVVSITLELFRYELK